jgi:hypothetical protein
MHSTLSQIIASIVYNLQKNCEAFKQYNKKQMKVAKRRKAVLEHPIEKGLGYKEEGRKRQE